VQSPFVLYAIAAFEKMFKRLELTLADSSPWIMGDAVTLADINLMPYVARLDYLGLLDLWTEHRPLVRAWWQHVVKWPGFQAGIARPMLAEEISEMSVHGPKLRPQIFQLLTQLRAVNAH
jgi:glutathione S-transferase